MLEDEEEVNPQEDDLSDLDALLKSSQCSVARITEFYLNGVNNTERTRIWKWLLGVSGSNITDWDVPVEHKDIEVIREEVCKITDVVSDQDNMIRILSYYCTARNTRYKPECGWAEVLLPLTSLSCGDMYACFYALLSKFVPRNCKTDGKPFHLFRLLLLYHDPELCAFLDTKKCPPDLYAQRWFRSLYAGKCDIHVIREMWTRYLLLGDSFMVFNLALVVLVNARDVIITGMDTCKNIEIAEQITTFPDKLSIEDVEDFMTLAKYYADRTPISFTRDYHSQLFGNAPIESHFGALSQALCLPISVSELLHKTTITQGVIYLVIDCRPKLQFDSGHLSGSIHLDPDTMLSDPAMFTTNVASVLVTQSKTFLEEELSSNHLCFMGSGREEEDQLLNMVVAHFLHRKTQFVSTARYGYKGLHDLLGMDLDNGLESHVRETCVVCSEDAMSRMSDSELVVSGHNPGDTSNIVAKMSSAMKVTTVNVKNKIGSTIGSFWSEDTAERHVRAATKSKPYRGMENVFTIGDEDEDEIGGASSSEEEREVINIKLWENKSDVLSTFECEEITPDGKMFSSVLLTTTTHIYVLRRIPEREGMAVIRYRRSYSSIARITAKKKHPDVITFKFIVDNNQLQSYRFLIPNSKSATLHITSLIPAENHS